VPKTGKMKDKIVQKHILLQLFLQFLLIWEKMAGFAPKDNLISSDFQGKSADPSVTGGRSRRT